LCLRTQAPLLSGQVVTRGLHVRYKAVLRWK
jgi:hypothetical protein